jgi:glycosyltransferase involved in cell wall biosynthesis
MQKGLKIAMMIDAWFPIHGGGQVHVAKLIEHLVRTHGCEVDLYVRQLVDAKGRKWKKNEVHMDGKFRVFRVGPCTKFFNNRGRLSWLFSVIPSVMRNNIAKKYDLIHAHAFLAGMPGKVLSTVLRKPIVYTVHGTSLFHENSGFQAMVERKLICKTKYDREISVAHNFLQLNNVNKDVSVIPNGVDTAKFDKVKGTPPKNFTLLFVGRLDPIKGLHHLIKALPKNVHLKIVGDGEEESRLKRMAKDKNITFLGRVTGEDVIKLYKSSHLFVLPSLSEGQPITVLEAWAAKIPVLVTEVGDNPHMVRDGINGFMVDPDQVDQLADAIQRAHEMFKANPAKLTKMGEAGHTFVKKDFTWEKVAERVYDVYESL